MSSGSTSMGLDAAPSEQRPRGPVPTSDRARAASLTADEARGLLASIVQSSDDAIIGKRLDGTIFCWNAAAERLYGYEAAEVLGQPVLVIIPPERRNEFLRITERVARGERIEPFETARLGKDGRLVPVWLTISPILAASGRALGASVIARDITARKRIEGALQAAVDQRTSALATANQQLRREIERRQQAEALLDGEKRVLELIATGAAVDEALTAICRTVEEHAAGVRCAIRILADGVATKAGARLFGSVSLSGLPVAFPKIPRERCVAEDTSAVPGLKAWATRSRVRALWTEPIVGSAGQVLGTVLLAHDGVRSPTQFELEPGIGAARLAGIIIDKARADERAQRQLGELAHVARLATMGEMASGLAHELNQPLCAIVNYTEACLELLDAESGNPALRQALTEVARQSERAGAVIRRLREFVRHREPQRAEVDVNQAVREVVGLTRAELRQQEVKVELRLRPGLPLVLADPIQIQQVIVNLVRNAVDAMSDVQPRRRRLRVRSTRHGEFIEVDVQDSGRGISADVREQVFESFFTTKKHGMGMGLSISRSIIEMHDGRIWITPNPRTGVTFRFTLPLARRTPHGRREPDRIRRR